MTYFGALVALLGGVVASSSSLRGGVGAVTGNVTRLATLVACLVLGSLGAVSAQVTFTTTVVALSWATSRAVTGLVGWVAAVVAGAVWCGSSVSHGFGFGSEN